MAEKPILFSAPMVRAILDGTKTQTRRVVNGVPSFMHCGKDIMDWGLSGIEQDDDGQWWLLVQTDVDDNSSEKIKCPYGAPGDQLWVRETFALTGDNASPIVHPQHGGVAWRATDHPNAFKWKPSIFMPRWASRITLEVVSVRVERLNEISEKDAMAEGVNWKDHAGLASKTAKKLYRDLWESINDPGSWEANPFVWVIEFKRVERGQ